MEPTLAADIVVVGFGFAGGVAAIEAHDQGRSVLILEKAAHPGGLSIVSGGGLAVGRDPDSAPALFAYLQATCGGLTPDPVLWAMAEGMVALPAYLAYLQRVSNQELKDMRAVIDPGAHATYPFPGAEAIRSMKIAQDPAFGYFPWVRGMRGGARLFKVVWDNVGHRGIPVHVATPMERLLTDGRGRVIGVQARNAEGAPVWVYARRGVVLACGGFENAAELKGQVYPARPVYPIAGLTNTGDGIREAQRLGAALWHLVNFHGGYGFKFPGFPQAFRHRFGGPRVPTRRFPWIIVDQRGRRYMNEVPPAPQDTPIRDMSYFDPDEARYPRIPSYLLVDAAGLASGPLAQPIFQGDAQPVYEWSSDNQREVARGWIQAAPTVAGLAAKLGLPPAVLQETVAAWNAACASGQDPWGRLPGTMMPLRTPPFYGVQTWPVVSNTQGGPVHDAAQRVLDVDGRPIPHLYAAGELGSLFGHLYLEAGNVAECFVTGRVAAQTASREEPVAWAPRALAVAE